MFAINFAEIVGSDSIKHQIVTPLWNSSVDTDEIGNCYIINKNEGDATVERSALTSCTVRVISANGVTISLKTASQNGPMGLNNLVLYFKGTSGFSLKLFGSATFTGTLNLVSRVGLRLFLEH